MPTPSRKPTTNPGDDLRQYGLTYGELLRLTEGRGTSEIYVRNVTALQELAETRDECDRLRAKLAGEWA